MDHWADLRSLLDTAEATDDVAAARRLICNHEAVLRDVTNPKPISQHELKRVEISALALQGLYGELDRAALDDDLLRGVSFVCADAAQASEFRQSHLFSFDRIFSAITMKSLAEVLQRSPFRVLVSTRSPRIW